MLLLEIKRCTRFGEMSDIYIGNIFIEIHEKC